MSGPTVFISYSHQDETWKDQLVRQLRVLEINTRRAGRRSKGASRTPASLPCSKGLAGANPGLCVVTTRERIADLAGFQKTAPQIPLEELEPDAAVALLRQLGVKGRESELPAAAEEFQRHALTLTLLGNFLRRAHGGDVRKRCEIDLHRADEKQGGHASRVIAAYARWLGEGPELAILRLLGFFDRPAEAGALKALRAAPPIPELTEPLVDLSEEDWHLATAVLREDHSLLATADPREPETLDASTSLWITSPWAAPTSAWPQVLRRGSEVAPHGEPGGQVAERRWLGKP